MMRRVVVFPQPEGPSRVKNSPSSITSDTPASAASPLKRFTTPSKRTRIASPSGPHPATSVAEPLLQIVVPLQDELSEYIVHLTVPSLCGVVVVDVAHRLVEERARPGEFSHALQRRTRGTLHPVFRRNAVFAARHDHRLPLR